MPRISPILKEPAWELRSGRSYWPGVGLGVGCGLAVGDAAAADEEDAVAEADADEDDEPLGTGVTIGVGLGEGKIVLATFANERAKMSTKMTKTITTQIRARLSLRGGSEPRYPADGAPER